MRQATDRLANPRLNLIEERLGHNLAEYVTEWRDVGISWRRLARILAERTRVQITGEALRVWWSALPPETPEALVSRGAHS